MIIYANQLTVDIIMHTLIIVCLCSFVSGILTSININRKKYLNKIIKNVAADATMWTIFLIIFWFLDFLMIMMNLVIMDICFHLFFYQFVL